MSGLNGIQLLNELESAHNAYIMAATECSFEEENDACNKVDIATHALREYLIENDKDIKNFIESHMDDSWNKMGDTGSANYVVNQESYNFGYYRALEDVLDFIERGRGDGK